MFLRAAEITCMKYTYVFIPVSSVTKETKWLPSKSAFVYVCTRVRVCVCV